MVNLRAVAAALVLAVPVALTSLVAALNLHPVAYVLVAAAFVDAPGTDTAAAAESVMTRFHAGVADNVL